MADIAEQLTEIYQKWVDEGATPFTTAETLDISYNDIMQWAAQMDWVALSYKLMDGIPVDSNAVVKVPNALAFTAGFLMGVTIGPRVPDTLPADWSS